MVLFTSEMQRRSQPCETGSSERGDGASPLPTPHGSHFGAAREERDGPSPLPDG